MPSEKSNSETSDSDDDNLAQLDEAVDKDFINDRMFERVGTNSDECRTDASEYSVTFNEDNNKIFIFLFQTRPSF